MRFVVEYIKNAEKKGWIDAGIYDPEHWGLWECDDTGKPVRFVGCDGGEPEDQLLVRDWKWVPEEMNKFAAEIARLTRERDEAKERIATLEAALREARDLLVDPPHLSFRQHVAKIDALLAGRVGGITTPGTGDGSPQAVQAVLTHDMEEEP